MAKVVERSEIILNNLIKDKLKVESTGFSIVSVLLLQSVLKDTNYILDLFGKPEDEVLDIIFTDYLNEILKKKSKNISK